MKVVFEGQLPEQIYQQFQEQLMGRKLGSLVKIDYSGEEMNVVISKLGTSRLHFQIKEVQEKNSVTVRKNGDFSR